jgi:hypothetical protein
MKARRPLGMAGAGGLALVAVLLAGFALTHRTAYPVRHATAAATVPPTPTARISPPTPSPTTRPGPAPTVTATRASVPQQISSPHVRTGGITYDITRLQAIQRAVDGGGTRYRYYRNPVQVTVRDLPQYGFDARRIEVVSPAAPHVAPTAHHGEDGLPETDVIVRYGSRQYWIVLNQFVEHGPTGIWSIITITPM